MLVISINGNINGKSHFCIKYGNEVYSCELENPRICIPASGGIMTHKDVTNLIKFLAKFDPGKGETHGK